MRACGPVPPQCPVGTYNPLSGQTFATACLRCPEFSTTSNHSSTNITDCFCEDGFEASFLEDGTMVCECAVGYEIVNNARCEPCPLATFKNATGNNKCVDCPVPRTTTAQTGADAESLCVRDVGTFASARDEAGRVLSCSTCRSTHAVASVDMTSCHEPGVTLEGLPLLAGFWRMSEKASIVRACALSGNTSCVGGRNASVQCAAGYRGPLCSLCEDGYVGGRGATCEMCEGDAVVTIATAVGGFLLAILIVALLVARMRRRMAHEAAEGGNGADDVVSTSRGGRGEAGGGNPAGLKRKAKVLLLVHRASAGGAPQPRGGGSVITRGYNLLNRVGVKLRILVSFGQVISQLNVVYAVEYPDLYKVMLRVLSQLNLSLNLLPVACIFPSTAGFAIELLFKTLFPLLASLLLILASRLLRRRRRDQPEGFPDFIADVCSDLWFVLIFLTYPSTCATIFKFFAHDVFDGPGEDTLVVLRADASIVVGSPLYLTLLVYAVPMLVLFPLGIPVLYSAMLFRSRRTLRELRSIERKAQVDFEAAELEAKEMLIELKRLRADAGGDDDEDDDALAKIETLEEKRTALLAAAESAREAATERYESLHEELPTTLRKLTAGYEMRCFWFEIFECVRKILIVGVPVFLPTGSPGQLVVGLLMCFITSCIYASFAPFEDPLDDRLSTVCQLSIFFSLLASIVTNAYPNEPAMAVILPMLLVAPVVLAAVEDLLVVSAMVQDCRGDDGASGGAGDAGDAGGALIGRLSRTSRALRDACTRRLDRALGSGAAEACVHPEHTSTEARDQKRLGRSACRTEGGSNVRVGGLLTLSHCRVTPNLTPPSSAGAGGGAAREDSASSWFAPVPAPQALSPSQPPKEAW